MRFSDLAVFLEEHYGIQSRDRIAFAGRLKHFVKLGWPSGVKRGRGVPGEYDQCAVCEMFFVMELAAVGIQPERAIEAVKGNLVNLTAAVEGDGQCVLRLPPSFGTRLPKATINIDLSALKLVLEGMKGEQYENRI